MLHYSSLLLLLALVELGEPLSGFPHFRVVGVVAQVPIGFGRQGRVFRLGVPQTRQQPLAVLLFGPRRIFGLSHGSILPEALPERS